MNYREGFAKKNHKSPGSFWHTKQGYTYSTVRVVLNFPTLPHSIPLLQDEEYACSLVFPAFSFSDVQYFVIVSAFGRNFQFCGSGSGEFVPWLEELSLSRSGACWRKETGDRRAGSWPWPGRLAIMQRFQEWITRDWTEAKKLVCFEDTRRTRLTDSTHGNMPPSESAYAITSNFQWMYLDPY